MPLTFSEPSGRRMSTGRRPSASSPYPVRVMTSIRPSDYPSPSGSKSSKANTPSKSNSKDDPFTDNTSTPPATTCDYECLTNSPQEERVSLPIPAQWRDAERQPLLGSEREERSRAVRWTMAMGLVIATVVGAVIVVGVVRMGDDKRETVHA